MLDPDRIERARRGDAQAFESLVEARIDPMLRTAVAILGHETEARDAVQDTLLAAWRELRTLRDPAAFDGWLIRILVNRCKRMGRSVTARRTNEVALDAVDADGVPAGFDIGALDERRALERAFERLPLDQRTILVLHHLDRRSVADIASALEIPEGTAKSRLFAARGALERSLAREAAR